VKGIIEIPIHFFGTFYKFHFFTFKNSMSSMFGEYSFSSFLLPKSIPLTYFYSSYFSIILKVTASLLVSLFLLIFHLSFGGALYMLGKCCTTELHS
jgi:hypothetical protein